MKAYIVILLLACVGTLSGAVSTSYETATVQHAATSDTAATALSFTGTDGTVYTVNSFAPATLLNTAVQSATSSVAGVTLTVDGTRLIASGTPSWAIASGSSTVSGSSILSGSATASGSSAVSGSLTGAGSAAYHAASDFATGTQGTKADLALVQSLYVMPSMMANSSGGDQALHINVSVDGLSWTDINNGAPVYTPASGVLRDPSIVRDNTGTFWCAYTSGTYGYQNYFGLAKSTDLYNWTFVSNVVTHTGTGVGDSSYTTWGPCLVIDGSNIMHAIVASWQGAASGTSVAAYEVHTTGTDYSVWSPASTPIVMTDPVNSSRAPWNVAGISAIGSGTYLGVAQFAADGYQYPATSTDLVNWTISGTTNISAYSETITYNYATYNPLEDGIILKNSDGRYFQYAGTSNNSAASYAADVSHYGGAGLMWRDLGLDPSNAVLGKFIRLPQTCPIQAPNKILVTSGSGLNFKVSPIASSPSAVMPSGPTLMNPALVSPTISNPSVTISTGSGTLGSAIFHNSGEFVQAAPWNYWNFNMSTSCWNISGSNAYGTYNNIQTALDMYSGTTAYSVVNARLNPTGANSTFGEFLNGAGQGSGSGWAKPFAINVWLGCYQMPVLTGTDQYLTMLFGATASTSVGVNPLNDLLSMSASRAALGFSVVYSASGNSLVAFSWMGNGSSYTYQNLGLLPPSPYRITISTTTAGVFNYVVNGTSMGSITGPTSTAYDSGSILFTMSNGGTNTKLRTQLNGLSITKY